jgi:hemerythrin-like domain-containing protein
MHPTLRIIRSEHATLSALLRSIGLLLSESRRHGVAPDFQVLRAMLYYIEEFPERVHHPKETTLLFPRLRERSAALGAVLKRLDQDHERSHVQVRELQHDVLALEMMGEAPDAAACLARFESEMTAYIAGYLDHMRTEEQEVLPLAERVLGAADWAELDAAFMQNRDPLGCSDANDAFRPLFQRILVALPAPLGFGPALAAPTPAP